MPKVWLISEALHLKDTANGLDFEDLGVSSLCFARRFDAEAQLHKWIESVVQNELANTGYEHEQEEHVDNILNSVQSTDGIREYVYEGTTRSARWQIWESGIR